MNNIKYLFLGVSILVRTMNANAACSETEYLQHLEVMAPRRNLPEPPIEVKNIMSPESKAQYEKLRSTLKNTKTDAQDTEAMNLYSSFIQDMAVILLLGAKPECVKAYVALEITKSFELTRCTGLQQLGNPMGQMAIPGMGSILDRTSQKSQMQLQQEQLERQFHNPTALEPK